jgi:hypothetical protein
LSWLSFFFYKNCSYLLIKAIVPLFSFFGGFLGGLLCLEDFKPGETVILSGLGGD